MRFSYGQRVPKALWRFRVSTSNSLSGRTGRPTDTHFAIFIIFTLKKIFEYVEMTILAAQEAVLQSQGALTSSCKYLSTRDDRFRQLCTRVLIDRTLICNAILYHFQITLSAAVLIVFDPTHTFLLSRPLEQLEFIRLSNFTAEICFVVQSKPTTTIYAPTQLPKSISTTSLQSKTSFSNHPCETIS